MVLGNACKFLNTDSLCLLSKLLLLGNYPFLCRSLSPFETKTRPFKASYSWWLLADSRKCFRKMKTYSNFSKFRRLSAVQKVQNMHGNVTPQCQHIDLLPYFIRTRNRIATQKPSVGYPYSTSFEHPHEFPVTHPTLPLTQGHNQITKHFFAQPYNNKRQK